MGVTYHFGYPNMQRIVAIDEAVNNAQNGEKYQVNYRGKYRPLTVIEVPIEMLVYQIFERKVCRKNGLHSIAISLEIYLLAIQTQSKRRRISIRYLKNW